MDSVLSEKQTFAGVAGFNFLSIQGGLNSNCELLVDAVDTVDTVDIGLGGLFCIDSLSSPVGFGFSFLSTAGASDC